MELQTQEIAVLGLLLDGPSHGYALRQRLRGILSRIAPLHGGTLYYTLDKLVRAGLVRYSGEEQKGSRPRRRLCAITSRGKKCFTEGALRLFRPEFRPFFPMHLTIFFRRHLDDEALAQAVRERRDVLRAYAGKLTEGELVPEPPLEISWLLEHVLSTVTTTADWLDRLLKELE